MSVVRKREGLGFLRFIMVLASISPLFVLWAIRGTCQAPSAPCELSGVASQAPKKTCLLPNNYFLIVCGIFIVVPNLLLLWRLRTAREHSDTREIIVGKAEDHRDHLLVYLFAMLLPFYATNLTSWREFSATLLAVCFIVFLFWNCNLHYMNILFAVFGYRIFTIYSSRRWQPTVRQRKCCADNTAEQRSFQASGFSRTASAIACTGRSDNAAQF